MEAGVPKLNLANVKCIVGSYSARPQPAPKSQRFQVVNGMTIDRAMPQENPLVMRTERGDRSRFATSSKAIGRCTMKSFECHEPKFAPKHVNEVRHCKHTTDLHVIHQNLCRFYDFIRITRRVCLKAILRPVEREKTCSCIT